MKAIRPPKQNGPSTSPSSVIDPNQVYEVDTLLDARLAYHGETGVRCLYYLVQWKDFEDQSWEPEENIEASLIAEYYANKKAPKKTRRAAPIVAKKVTRKCFQDSGVFTSSEEEAFKCNVDGCERKYKTAQGLRQHKRKAHPPTVGVDVGNRGLKDQSDDNHGIPIPAVPEPKGQVSATVAQTTLEESCPSDVETSSSEVPSTTVMEVDQETEVRDNLTPRFTSEERQAFVPQSTGSVIGECENRENLVEGQPLVVSGKPVVNTMSAADGPSHPKKKTTYEVVDDSKGLYENWKLAENTYIKSLQESLKTTQDKLAAETELRCFEYMKYRRTQREELDKKDAEMAELVVKNQELLRESLDVIAEKQELKQDKQHLRATTKQLTQENQQLILEKQQLKESIDQLREDKDQLALEKKELMESIALINQKQQLMQSTEQLRLENQHLMERADQIGLEKQQIMQSMEQLNQEKQQLTLDNENLRLKLQSYREILEPVANKILKLN